MCNMLKNAGLDLDKMILSETDKAIDIIHSCYRLAEEKVREVQS